MSQELQDGKPSTSGTSIGHVNTYENWVVGTKATVTAGTPVQITGTSTSIKCIVIKAKAGNTGIVYVGNSNTTEVFELSAKESITVPINDLSKIWIDSAVNGEGVCYAYVY